MKCVCVQYVVALQRMRLKLGGNVPRRTVRLAWVPDEEVGGADGMGILLGSTWFKEVAVGVALDEVGAIVHSLSTWGVCCCFFLC